MSFHTTNQLVSEVCIYFVNIIIDSFVDHLHTLLALAHQSAHGRYLFRCSCFISGLYECYIATSVSNPVRYLSKIGLNTLYHIKASESYDNSTVIMFMKNRTRKLILLDSQLNTLKTAVIGILHSITKISIL